MPDQLSKILTAADFRDYVINSEVPPDKGLVFCYPSWSSSYIILRSLLKCLKNYGHSTDLYIYDIDSAAFERCSRQYDFKSKGKGELVFLRHKQVVACQDKYTNHAEDVINLFLKTVVTP